jgi:hypothetical protein
MWMRALQMGTMAVGLIACTKPNPIYCDGPEDCESGVCLIEVNTCIDDPTPRLMAIDVWADSGTPATAAWTPAFDPAATDYEVDVGLVLQRARVSAVPIDPMTAVMINGAAVPAGELSAPIPLGLGETVVTVVGTSPGGVTAVYTVRVARAGQIAQDVYAKASNAGANDQFGLSVAISGDTLAVGAPYESSAAIGVNGDEQDNSAFGSGAVYVFTRDGVTWTQEAFIKASNTESSDRFGESIALSGDTLAVGARYESSSATGVGGDQGNNGATQSGAVYVFTRGGTGWSQEAYIKASNSEASDEFGRSVALSGSTLAVGATREDSGANGVNGVQSDNGASGSGAVYVFVRSGGLWSQEAYVKASSSEAGDNFGISVALDVDTLAVGADGEDSSATGIDGDEANNAATGSGALYVFARSGGTWSQDAYVKASNTESDDFFGASVTLSGDTLAVSAPGEDSGVVGAQADNGAASSGAVYVFTRAGSSWSQQAYLKASNPASNDFFGPSLALFGDLLVVGALGEDSRATGVEGSQADNGAVEAGAAYLFVRGQSAWSQHAYIKASNTDAGDAFGVGIAASTDGLVIGAPFERSRATGIGGDQSDNSGVSAGAVYLFR